LVRDRIPEIIAANRQQAVCSMLDGKAYQEALRQKLREETEEHLNNRTLEELADILESIHPLAQTHGYSSEELERLRAHKARIGAALPTDYFQKRPWSPPRNPAD